LDLSLTENYFFCELPVFDFHDSVTDQLLWKRCLFHRHWVYRVI